MCACDCVCVCVSVCECDCVGGDVNRVVGTTSLRRRCLSTELCEVRKRT